MYSYNEQHRIKKRKTNKIWEMETKKNIEKQKPRKDAGWFWLRIRILLFAIYLFFSRENSTYKYTRFNHLCVVYTYTHEHKIHLYTLCHSWTENTNHPIFNFKSKVYCNGMRIGLLGNVVGMVWKRYSLSLTFVYYDILLVVIWNMHIYTYVRTYRHIYLSIYIYILY